MRDEFTTTVDGLVCAGLVNPERRAEVAAHLRARHALTSVAIDGRSGDVGRVVVHNLLGREHEQFDTLRRVADAVEPLIASKAIREHLDPFRAAVDALGDALGRTRSIAAELESACGSVVQCHQEAICHLQAAQRAVRGEPDAIPAEPGPRRRR